MRMPHIESNTPQDLFDSPVKDEFLRIARSTLYLRDFLPKGKSSLERLKQQGLKYNAKRNSLQKIVLTRPESFQHFSMSFQDLLNIFLEDN